ncbi:MAG TPA: hypothetical protein VJL29_07790 [Thermoguttaceae bacterium]|nr:hypothetical protein [Thermoguttaceae bacterium]
MKFFQENAARGVVISASRTGVGTCDFKKYFYLEQEVKRHIFSERQSQVRSVNATKSKNATESRELDASIFSLRPSRLRGRKKFYREDAKNAKEEKEKQ